MDRSEHPDDVIAWRQSGKAEIVIDQMRIDTLAESLERGDAANKGEVVRYDIGARPARAQRGEPHGVETEARPQFENPTIAKGIGIESGEPAQFAGGTARRHCVPPLQQCPIWQLQKVGRENPAIRVAALGSFPPFLAIGREHRLFSHD